MSKAEILQELPKLRHEERTEILEHLCELEERDQMNGVGPTPAEKALLDGEFEAYRQNPDDGSSWQEVQARLRGRSKQ
ncbi:MAG: hypothetical protein HY043_06120 [Verrucomicrobia bacterium]|nr:hypothetical protein [Verrucomicrobiota bacterium]